MPTFHLCFHKYQDFFVYNVRILLRTLGYYVCYGKQFGCCAKKKQEKFIFNDNNIEKRRKFHPITHIGSEIIAK